MSEHAEQKYEEFRETFLKIQQEVSKQIVGQKEIIEGVLICLMTGGHALLEGVPGLGKTLLIRTLHEVLDLNFSRIQFTPDLMPADIIGTTIVAEDEAGRKFFEFQQGPVFGNLILADEINRATPQNTVCLVRSDAGKIRDRCRTAASPQVALLRHGDAKPVGDGRHLSVA